MEWAAYFWCIVYFILLFIESFIIEAQREEIKKLKDIIEKEETK